MAKILLIEDDLDLAESVVQWLKRENHTVEWTTSGQEALSFLAAYDYELVITDWGLPGASGPEICREIRSKGKVIPVLMFSGRNLIPEKEYAFDTGIDDYLTKPFDMRELSVRIRALLRRAAGLPSQVLAVDDLVLDPKTFQVVRSGQEIKLQPREFAVLEFLMRHRGEVFTSETLLNKVWATDSEATPDAVRQCMRRLRAKLQVPGSSPVIVHQAGLGYRIEPTK